MHSAIGILLRDYYHKCQLPPVFGLQAASNSKNLDIGANLFIGNLDPEIDEKLLYDTFSAFGVILETPKVFLHVMRKSNNTTLQLRVHVTCRMYVRRCVLEVDGCRLFTRRQSPCCHV